MEAGIWTILAELEEMPMAGEGIDIRLAAIQGSGHPARVANLAPASSIPVIIIVRTAPARYRPGIEVLRPPAGVLFPSLPMQRAAKRYAVDGLLLAVLLAARSGGVEIYKVEQMELQQGDRIRWTRNDKGLGLVNSQTAEVESVKGGRVTFRLEDGRTLDMTAGDLQLRHVDRAWTSTVHAFQGRTIDTAIAAMEANHPNLTNQKTLYVEISRARDRAELVTDDAKALRERLEAATGERIAALEAVAPEKAKTPEARLEVTHSLDREGAARESKGRRPGMEKTRASKSVDRDLGL